MNKYFKNRLFHFILISTLFTLTSFRGCQHKNSVKEFKAWQVKYFKAQLDVKNWIRKFSKYPNSYENISFNKCIVHSSEDNRCETCNYISISHKFSLLNKDSLKETVEYVFEIDKNNFIKAYLDFDNRPNNNLFYDIFIEKFGRKLNKFDSSYLLSNPIDLVNKKFNQIDKILKEQKK